MIKFVTNIITKYKQIIVYGICGLITTLINIVSFYICRTILGIELIPSNTIAWILAFIFAFFSNKIWVFGSKKWEGKEVIGEMVGFLIARLATLLLDMVLIVVLVDFLHWNELFSKVLISAIVIVTNFLASKMVVFRKAK